MSGTFDCRARRGYGHPVCGRSGSSCPATVRGLRNSSTEDVLSGTSEQFLEDRSLVTSSYLGA
jgi:hypothetical protein